MTYWNVCGNTCFCWRTFKAHLGCWLPFIPFSVKMILHCFNNVEVRALRGQIHDWWNFIVCFHIQVWFYCTGSMFGFIFMSCITWWIYHVKQIATNCCRYIFLGVKKAVLYFSSCAIIFHKLKKCIQMILFLQKDTKWLKIQLKMGSLLSCLLFAFSMLELFTGLP